MVRGVRVGLVVVVVAFAVAALPRGAAAGGQCLVLNQIYPVGGTNSSKYNRNFVEVLNTCSSAASLTGVFLHVLNSDNTVDFGTALSGSVAAGRFYLIAFGSATGMGFDLPAPDAEVPATLFYPGKVYLTTSGGSGSCPAGPNLIDLVGYGSSTNPCFEGSGPTAGPSDAYRSLLRQSCTDSDDNAADFVERFAFPRNSSLASPQCGGMPSPCLVVNEVYGPGGTASSTYDRSYVELVNRCNATISLYSVLIANFGSSGATEFDFDGPLGPGHFLLEAFGAAGSGAAVPTPDIDNPFSFQNPGRTFLRFITTPLQCPSGPSLIDLVGYGSGTPCFEISLAPAPSATQAIRRNGCIDTNNNGADFALAAPAPKNSSSTPVAVPCGPPTAVTVASFGAVRSRSGILLRWRTGSEAGLLGFGVYREGAGTRVKLTSGRIPSVFGGTASGRSYSWLDRHARSGSRRYWLRSELLNGERHWYGPISLRGRPVRYVSG